jgi:nitroreductase
MRRISSSQHRLIGGPPLFAARRKFFRWRRSSSPAAEHLEAASLSANSKKFPSHSLPSLCSDDGDDDDGRLLAALEAVVMKRRSCKAFDAGRGVDEALLRRLLDATVRAPSGFNLQPWTCVVATDAKVRAALAVAALQQPQIATAPVTIVFAGDTDPVALAPAALELGLQSGYYRPGYGPQYLRMINYMLHGGPCQTMAAAKSILSHWYSANTRTPLLSVPLSQEAYAWKQTMIPVAIFVLLATSAGLDTCIMEGIDNAMVREAVGLPARYSVPCVVAVGYADASKKGAFHSVQSPRFNKEQLVRWNKF